MDALKLTKMSGSGNDFLVLGDEASRALAADPQWVRRVCTRRLSVGADGVLAVEPGGTGRARVTFRNPDGSEAFCGNGTRCAARYAWLRGWVGRSMVLETAIGEVPAEVGDGRVLLRLPPPRDLGVRRIEVAGKTLAGRWIDAGVPHFVVEVASVAEIALDRWGPSARRHPEFGPAGVNLDLVQREDGARIRVRTWERGVEGETLACGSGAVAAAFALRLEGAGEALEVRPASRVPIEVRLPGPSARPLAALVAGDARLIFEAELGPDAVRGFEVS